jgi:type III pantothenate kinase
MILVDIGNSGLRATRVPNGGLFSNEVVYRLSWSANFASQRKPIPQQQAQLNQRWCSLDEQPAYDWLVDQFALHPEEEWLISCVQRTALDRLQKSITLHGPNAIIREVRFDDLPIKINVEHPSRTGIDRLLAAFAAHSLVKSDASSSDGPRPLIVVQAGTAITIDFVDASGVFQGGSIMPGLGLSLQLLAAGTDQLPWLGNHSVESDPVLPGKNTEQAIAAGVNAAMVGGAVHLIYRYRHQNASTLVQVFVSGGDGPMLLPHLEEPFRFVDHLVLLGLSHLGLAKQT